jgi:hypothetical protein
MEFQETDADVRGIIKLRDYDPKKGTGMFYIPAELYEKLKNFKDKDLVFKLNKTSDEICIKPFVLEY